MVKEFQQHGQVEWPWTASVYAFYERYPNPTATHVLSVDVIDRRIVPRSTPHSQWPHAHGESTSPAPTAASPYDDPLVLRTTRLLLKKGTLPKWAPKGLLKNAESWVLEESEVELQPSIGSSGAPRRNIRSWTRNIDHTTVLAITEATRFKEAVRSTDSASVKGKERALDPDLPDTATTLTLTTTSAHISSQISFAMLQRRIESFGLTRFIAHKDTSREGVIWAIKTHWLPHTQAQAQSELDLAEQQQPKRRRVIASAFRPPFLDGLPASPVQRLRQWIENGAWLAPHRQGTALIKAQVYDDSRSSALGGGSEEVEANSERPGRFWRARQKLAQWFGLALPTAEPNNSA
ncbi:unnamed protein product [Tilletia controversa]|uniref:PRELI/MSF1 domain-containing protein n=3 Tax=Tilletia TaxID=13289 RepID=A0A8X7MN98_9BASI|nr:hypothetical protein CF336_g7062 [Tilletia laevis]KAE8188700.1 hypothetical protein CF328_g6519 [Tilletia controversa]KAE8249682.1 hypothetical protein A4X03_0g6574 [Tilletia caries]KAE8190229.1 hypothetical protein CF335_g6409 [Tilletia laevis]KAE8242248.1 hypothetical protein A4X06_0g7090 [Tilletia controversa]